MIFLLSESDVTYSEKSKIKMKKQRLNEWISNDDDDYADSQFKTTYRSTIKFCNWLEQLGVLNPKSECNILDIGTGKGANLYYMQQRFPNCQYNGIDINNGYVQDGNAFFTGKKIKNCKLEYGDLYNLDSEKYENRFEGIISYQTLSWLPEYEKALDGLIRLNPNWISLTSLFYEGLIDAKIEIISYKSPQDKNSFRTISYNTYSLPRIENFFFERGYKIFKYFPFEIDIDISKPEDLYMQTYTQKLPDGKRLQISGPLLMNWFFIFAARM
jgi:ubiquinone/menaquinone biosynthesis C-methylase UbiE